MQVGKCVFLWALRGRLLDTIHWKSLILEVVPGDPGGEWKLRQGRKAASTEHVIKQVTTVGNWNSVSLGASGKQHRIQISVFSNWGARELGYLSTTSYQSLVDCTYGSCFSLAFLAWLCRSQCVPQRPEKVSDKWMQMLAFGSWARVWWLRMRREKLGIDSTYDRADPQSDHELSSLSFHLFLEL